MRRPASFPLALIALGLSGCSGLGQFTEDTFTVPGANPNKPSGVSENIMRAEAKPVQETPVVPEPGNVWPGPPQPFPTLSEVERETQNGQVVLPGSSGGGGQGAGGASAGASGAQSGGGGKFHMQSNANAASTIVIPNGNGTSTVIAPDGSVKVIPTPKAPASP